MRRSRFLVCLFVACGVIVVGCSRADDPSATREQQQVVKSPPLLLSECLVPLTAATANTADEAVRLASYTPPEHNQVPRRSEQPLSDVGHQAYQTLAQAAKAYQTSLSVIANNLANAETTAFKRSRVILEDLSYRHEKMPGGENTAGEFTATGISVGAGVRVAGVQTDFTQGTLHQTGGQLDLAVEGHGFFQVTDPSGDTLYTRAGNFSKNANGQIVTSSAGTGRLLQPPITIPEDGTDVLISPEGLVSVRQPGSPNLSQIGQIELANFVNPEGLLKLGENLYAETDSSGPAVLGNPRQNGIGSLRQGTLEASNVQTDHELIEWKKTAERLRMIRQLMQVE